VTELFTSGEANVAVAPEELIDTESDPTTPLSVADEKFGVAASVSSNCLLDAVIPEIVTGFAFTVTDTGVVVDAAS
jgi:hypothetical protein